MLLIAFSQSKYYVDNLSENIKRGHRNKLKEGIWPRNAPMGYLNNSEKKIIFPDPERSPYIKKAFEAYASGKYTLRQIRDIITKLGLRSMKSEELSVSVMHEILRNPIFCGLMRYGGEIHEGKHEPIITKKLFDQCQEVMSRKSKPKETGFKTYLSRGFFRCGECGCFITTETQKGHNYLRCTKRKNPCTQKYVREEIITSQIKENIKKVSLPLDWLKWMIDENKKDQSLVIQSSEIFSQSTKDKISLLDSKIEKLMTAYLENALSLEEYRDAKSALVCSKQLLKEKLSSFEKKSHNRFELTEKFLKDNITNMELANEKTNEENLHLFQKVGSNFKIHNRTVLFEPRGAWKILAGFGFGADSPTSSALRADAFFRGDALTQNLRSGRDSNPRPLP
ncbi:recombinase family protein [Patescibacteria group bacterium]|nr:recombinase family protein [Patescibacteria group bacterium]MBU0879601.1 recombinase family protein [Patescibacteria group bacterium]MBU0879918.1 recombinase family protein [Patescibacteria group bacterium]MBU1062941.1 recombinase family protein [Patescibacteria group bacterium]MBU1783162.1 recombinase family protein [Patescibacteria group bacterium]